jgi:hypothetical protein
MGPDRKPQLKGVLQTVDRCEEQSAKVRGREGRTPSLKVERRIDVTMKEGRTNTATSLLPPAIFLDGSQVH